MCDLTHEPFTSFFCFQNYFDVLLVKVSAPSNELCSPCLLDFGLDMGKNMYLSLIFQLLTLAIRYEQITMGVLESIKYTTTTKCYSGFWVLPEKRNGFF